MEVYTSEYLSIIKQGNTLIQKWTKKELNADNYKKELQHFIEFFDQIRPENLIWDTQDCNLILPESLDEWVGNMILLPVYQRGIRQLIFNVPSDLSVHLSIVETLDKSKSILQPIYFSNYQEAKNYVEEEEKITLEANSPVIQCAQNKDKTSYDINVNVTPNDLPKILAYVDQLSADNEFVKLHEVDYFSLTVRELEILKSIVNGKANKEIATEFFIAESTVKTHRKQIKRKLKIRTNYDLYQYARCFGLLE